jgi:hypothetical protein
MEKEDPRKRGRRSPSYYTLPWVTLALDIRTACLKAGIAEEHAERYSTALADDGFDDLDSIVCYGFSLDSLTELGFKKGHAAKLFRQYGDQETRQIDPVIDPSSTLFMAPIVQDDLAKPLFPTDKPINGPSHPIFKESYEQGKRRREAEELAQKEAKARKAQEERAKRWKAEMEAVELIHEREAQLGQRKAQRKAAREATQRGAASAASLAAATAEAAAKAAAGATESDYSTAGAGSKGGSKGRGDSSGDSSGGASLRRTRSRRVRRRKEKKGCSASVNGSDSAAKGGEDSVEFHARRARKGGNKESSENKKDSRRNSIGKLVVRGGVELYDWGKGGMKISRGKGRGRVVCAEEEQSASAPVRPPYTALPRKDRYDRFTEQGVLLYAASPAERSEHHEDSVEKRQQALRLEALRNIRARLGLNKPGTKADHVEAEAHQRVLKNFNSFWKLLYDNSGLSSPWVQSECQSAKSSEIPFKHFRRALHRTNIVHISPKDMVTLRAMDLDDNGKIDREEFAYFLDPRGEDLREFHPPRDVIDVAKKRLAVYKETKNLQDISKMIRRCSTDVLLYKERRLLKRMAPQAKVAAAAAAAAALAAASHVRGGVKVRGQECA